MIRGHISVAILFTLIMLSCGKAGIENANPKSETLGNDLTGNDFYSQFINLSSIYILLSDRYK
jgi:hypothetical protein